MVKSLIAFCIFGISLSGIAVGQNVANKREQKVRDDRTKVEAGGLWIYNDLEKAFRLAKQLDKPVLVVLRCIPCEECVKLDDDLVDNDPILKPLLEQFVCVRVVGTNGLDLNLFQYDTDQSFAVFMLNADKTIYGRFGTRSHRTEWLQDVSLEGMAQALSGALELHDDYPANKEVLSGKKGDPLEFASPEKYPSLSSKYTDKLNYDGEVVKSCIHCHQIGEARREFYWQNKKSIPEQLMHPYPHPKSIGLVLDPTKRAVVKAILQGTPASKSELQVGDEILSMSGQPLLSTADVQWVLHQTSANATTIELSVRRQGKTLKVPIQLPDNWRKLDDGSWRVASWQFSRFGLGGMRLESVSDSSANSKAIFQVKSVGQFGAHATAKNKGIQKGDLILSIDGRTDFSREADVFDFINQRKKIGETTNFKIVRGSESMSIDLPVQE